MKNKTLAKVTSKIAVKMGKAGLILKKHEPEILVVAGAVGTIGSTVLACRATLKVGSVLDEHKKNMESIHEVSEDPQYADEYSAEDAKKDTTINYVQTGLKIAKLYAPAVILGTLSLGAIFASNSMLRKRNLALAAAYATIDKSFKDYRGRVVEKYGEDIDKELKYGTTTQTITETVIDEETGKEKKVKTKVQVADPNLDSDYAMYFTKETSAYFDDCYDYNLSMLRGKEAYMTNLLQSKGHLTLNEVKRELGIEEDKAGMVVGWFYDKKDPDCESVVDLRIHEVYLDNHDGTFQKTIIIDPNVQGSIYELMGKKEEK